MRRLVLGVVIAAILPGCLWTEPSEPADATPTATPDIPLPVPRVSPVVTPAPVCNPLAAAGAQGCSVGEKCSWISIDESAEPIGMLGCVADGAVALGAACARGPAGETTGFDNCAAGGICIGSSGSVCKDICGFDGGASSACTTGEACARYDALGANGDDDPVIGACEPTCDPLKQTRIVGGVPTSCGAGKGCYLLESAVDTIAVCAGAGTPTHNMAITGVTWANSCAPGHLPRKAVQGAAGDECAGFCKAADVYDGLNDGRMGRPDYEGGDTMETNWMAPPEAATCESAGGTTVLPGVATTGESCKFVWTRELTENLTSFSNTLGWCFNHANWQYDPDGMEPINNTDTFPRSINTTMGDVLPPVDTMTPHNDAIYFGNLSLPAMFLGSSLSVGWSDQPRLDRLAPYFQ